MYVCIHSSGSEMVFARAIAMRQTLSRAAAIKTGTGSLICENLNEWSTFVLIINETRGYYQPLYAYAYLEGFFMCVCAVFKNKYRVIWGD